MKKQIGTITIKEGDVRDRLYECAAWYTRIELEPGTYPVYGIYEKYGYAYREEVRDKWYLKWVSYSVPGTIVEDNFQSLFCGNPVGKSYDRTQNAGKADTWHASGIYPFAVAKAILDGESSIVLDPGFKAVPVPFQYDGQDKVTYDIVEV